MPGLQTHSVLSMSVQGDVQRGSHPGKINKESGPAGQLGSSVDHGHVKNTLAPSKEISQAFSPSATAWGEFQPCTTTSPNFNKKTEIQTLHAISPFKEVSI